MPSWKPLSPRYLRLFGFAERASRPYFTCWASECLRPFFQPQGGRRTRGGGTPAHDWSQFFKPPFPGPNESPNAGNCEGAKTSRCRRYRSPCLVMPPSLCLPPEEFCRGVRPSQAANSRPERKADGSGMVAAKAVAVIGPIPGMVASNGKSNWSCGSRPVGYRSPRSASPALLVGR